MCISSIWFHKSHMAAGIEWQGKICSTAFLLIEIRCTSHILLSMTNGHGNYFGKYAITCVQIEPSIYMLLSYHYYYFEHIYAMYKTHSSTQKGNEATTTKKKQYNMFEMTILIFLSYFLCFHSSLANVVVWIRPPLGPPPSSHPLMR